MKRKIYTKSHDIHMLKEIDHDGGQFTAEESAYIIEKEFGNTVFKTKEDLFRNYLRSNWKKMIPLSFLIKHIIDNQYKFILSLGAGQCVFEYLLKSSLPENVTVVAGDYNDYCIKKANVFFPEITPVIFDFFKDEIGKLEDVTKLKFDMAVFFDSAYVMDDRKFINIFSGLKKAGVKDIIDFHGAYMDMRLFLYYLLSPLVKNNFIRKLFSKPLIIKDEYIGKFHGYARSRSELRNLYKKCGLELVKEISIGTYKYVAMLK